MLLQFKVSNYASIKNEVLFSLIPSSDKEHPENILTSGKHKAHSLAAIYGANASGKSSLFKAMTNAINYIRTSNLIQIGQKIPVVPFKFCEDFLSIPSKFEFTFIASNGKKYTYGFSATMDKVLEEYLYVYNSAKPSMIFDRTEDGYKFSRAEKNNLSLLTRMNTANKLFLSTATAWNAECTTAPFQWFAEKIDTQTSIDTLQVQALEEYRTNNAENVRFLQKLMKQADINISDVEVEIKDVSAEEMQVPSLVINNVILKPQTNHQAELKTWHRIVDESGEEKEYKLLLLEESLGTIYLFYFSSFLNMTLVN